MTMNLSRLAAIGNVDPGYRHYSKLITPGDDLELPEAYLKWYDVRRPDTSISDDAQSMAREFLRSEVDAGRLAIAGELGFVIHHLCDGPFYFLLVCTWRNCNEMWESVYGRNASAGEPYHLMPQGDHLEVICVWELGAVLHEQQAWTRYLYSARDEAAKLAYLGDRFTGTV